MIDRAIAGDGQQPWPKRAASRFESLNAIPYAEESFLNQVFGHGRIPHDREDNRVREPAKAVVQILHRIGVAALQTAREIFIVLSAEL